MTLDLARLQNQTYRLDETLDLGTTYGTLMAGVGRSPFAKPPKGEVAATRIVWDGDRLDTMIRGSMNTFCCRDLSIVGGTFHLMPKYGSGAGQGIFERVNFIGARFLAGDDSFNGNCDLTVFRDCAFVDCDVALENSTSQNISYLFEGLIRITRCNTFFRVGGGGLITLNYAYVRSCPWLFHVGGDGSKFGPENGRITVRGADYDKNHSTFAGPPIVILDTGHYGKYRRAHLEGINFHRTRPGILLDIQGNTEWTLRQNSCYYVRQSQTGEVR